MYTKSRKMLLILILQLIICGTMEESSRVDPSLTVVWGPGLDPHVTMRSRYFFLQLVDSNGANVTESPKNVAVAVEAKGRNSDEHLCRLWLQKLDAQDGSFIVRYRLYETCYDFSIIIMVNNEVVPSGSIHVDGPVYEEECHCPGPSVDNWLQRYQCSAEYPQMTQDLKAFQSVDFDNIRGKLIEEYDVPNSISICHYVIKDNRIFRRCYGQHTGFKIFSDSILLSLTRKVVLPEVEFFMNLGDWPLVPEAAALYPIFSWCGSHDTRDIVLPTYDLTESSLENMGRVMLDMLSVQGNTKTPWSEKIEKAFWRGRDSRRERLDLIDIGRKHPDLFNVSITNFFFFKDEVAKYGPGERHISFFEFFKYKYQLNIDGTVAAYRLPYLLAGDSVVLKQESKYYEYFYDHLVPFEHYVPIKRDLSDLVEKIRWVQGHDSEVRRISKAARSLMRHVALPRDVFCYHVALLQEWSKRIQSNITVLDGMEEVTQPEHSCSCAMSGKLDDDLSSKDEL